MVEQNEKPLVSPDILEALKAQNPRLGREDFSIHSRNHLGGATLHHIRQRGWRREWNMRLTKRAQEYNSRDQLNAGV